VYSPLEGGKLCRTHDPDQSPVKSQQSAPASSASNTKRIKRSAYCLMPNCLKEGGVTEKLADELRKGSGAPTQAGLGRGGGGTHTRTHTRQEPVSAPVPGRTHPAGGAQPPVPPPQQWPTFHTAHTTTPFWAGSCVCQRGRKPPCSCGCSCIRSHCSTSAIEPRRLGAWLRSFDQGFGVSSQRGALGLPLRRRGGSLRTHGPCARA
jgi:hypothetical protein